MCLQKFHIEQHLKDTVQREGGGLDKEGKGTKQEEMSPGTRPQLQPDGRPELVGAKYR